MEQNTEFYKNAFLIGAPLLCILIIITFIALGFFIAKQNIKLNCSECSESKDNNTGLKIITKRDLAYWFIIITIFCVFWVSSYLYKDAVLVEYISFSGTIVSIILAIVAIIFSYFQNFTSTNTADNLLKTSEKLVNSLENIENYNNSITEYQDNISNIISKVTELTEHMEDYASQLDKLGLDLKYVKSEVSSINTKTNNKSVKNVSWSQNDNNTFDSLIKYKNSTASKINPITYTIVDTINSNHKNDTKK